VNAKIKDTGSMRTIWSGKSGGTDLRVVDTGKVFVGIANLPGTRQIQVEADSREEAHRRLLDKLSKANPKYVGFTGARNRFLHYFPNGFHSEGYETEERNYKIAAKEALDRDAPLATVAGASGFSEAILSAFRNTNLLFPVEKARVQAALRGPNADRFINAAAKFALGDMKNGLAEMERALTPHNAVSWTVVTYLPFLWRPDAHMFLKPMVTKDFADRVGHSFAQDYGSRLSLTVYESLLDLTGKIESELVDLKPRDRIDVQSFIWVVGDYKDETEQPKP
jgi:hypothetical protein